jgi:hypothetical protein
MCPYLARQLSGFSTTGSKFVSIVCQTRMVSTGDTEVYTSLGLLEVYPTSSFEPPCSYARNVCSRGYKLVGRGCRSPSPWGYNSCYVCMDVE